MSTIMKPDISEVSDRIMYLVFRLKWKWKNRKWKNCEKKRKAFAVSCAKYYQTLYRKRYGNEVTKLWM